MVRVVRALVRGVGWLLTPAVVAAASAGALWLAARLGSGLASANSALAIAVGAAIGAGSAVFVWWVLSLRSARHHARRSSRGAEGVTTPATDREGAPTRPEASPSGPPPSSMNEAAD